MPSRNCAFIARRTALANKWWPDQAQDAIPGRPRPAVGAQKGWGRQFVTNFKGYLTNCLKASSATLLSLPFVFLLLCVLPTLAHSDTQDVKIGVLAYRGNETAIKMWAPTADYLTSLIPAYRFTIVPLDFREIGPAVKKSEVDFVLANTAIYVELEARYGVTRIATLKNQGQDGAYTVFGGVIFCLQDRKDILSMADIKGKSFMAVDEDSLGGWRIAEREFIKRGITPAKDFLSLQFGGTHDLVVDAVVNRQVDVGTVRTDVLERLASEGRIDLHKFRIINQQQGANFPFVLSSPLYPEWPFAKTSRATEALAQAVAIALLQMPPTSPAAEAGQITGWTTPLDYQPVHELMKELRIGPYQDYGKITLQDVLLKYWPLLASGVIVIVLMGSMLVYVARLNKTLKQSRCGLEMANNELHAEAKERRQAEAQVNQQNAFLRNVLDALSHPFYVIDAATYAIKLANKAAGFVVGAMGTPCYQLTHQRQTPCAGDQHPCTLAMVKKTKAPVTLEHIHFNQNGDPRNVEIHAYPIFDDQGEVFEVIEYTQDITERKRTERELHEQDLRLHAITDAAQEAIIMMNSEGNISFWNPAAERILGYPSAEAIGQNLHALIMPQRYAPAFQEAFPRFQREGQGAAVGKTIELEARRQDGTEISVEISLSAVYVHGGWYAVGLFHDISSRKEREATLRKLSSAVMNSPTTIVITDVQGQIEFVNPKFTEVTGYLPEEAIGQNPRILNAGVQTKELYREMWDTILAGREWRGDLCNRKKNGDTYWEDVSISPIRDEQGHITNFVSIKEDITEKKRRNRELREAKDAASAASQAKSEFLANMSHEIRTPLNAIIGFSSLTMEEANLPPRQHDYAQKIHTAGETLLAIIGDILDFSKIEAGQLTMEQIPFRLDTVLASAHHLVQKQAADKGLELLMTTAADVPLALSGDPHRLGQILVNLVNNAVKFTERGEIELTTTVLARINERVQLQFSVRDTGIGLSEAQLGKLFQPFTQADGSTTRRFGGTGLGLSISKQLATMMGGTIWCESTLGQGSTFSVTAWFAIGPVNDRQPGTAYVTQPPGPGASANLAGARVLVVEDNEFNQQLAAAFFKKNNVISDLAVNGQEAVAMVSNGNISYDLVLMDIQMPVMDGYEATRRIRADGRFARLPIIAMTAHAMLEERQAILQAGMDAHLTKPIDLQLLRQTMERFLPGQRLALPPCDLAPVVSGEAITIPVIAGVDSAAALQRLAGDREFYLMMLRSFIDKPVDDAALIEEALRLGDMGQAQRQAHTIKSAAGTIGAVALQELARALEGAIGRNESQADLQEALDRFASELHRVTLELRHHLPVVPAANDATTSPIDRAALAPILSRLLDLIREKNGKVEHYLDAYPTELAGLPAKEVGQLQTYLRNFNFSAAEDALVALTANNGMSCQTSDSEEPV